MRAPWLLRLLWQPDIELDLVRRPPSGNVQHGKVVGLVFFVVVVGCKIIGVAFTLGELIVLASAIFGSKMFYEFLQSRTATASEARTVTVNRTIIERRDPDLAIDPTP